MIQGSPDSRSRRKGESPVVKASVEMEEQIVNLEGRLARLSSIRTTISLTDSSGPGGTTPRPVSMAGIAEIVEVAKRRMQPIITQEREHFMSEPKNCDIARNIEEEHPRDVAIIAPNPFHSFGKC